MAVKIQTEKRELMAARTTVKISRTTRDLASRCEKLLSALPEPERSNIRFVAALTGGIVPDPDRETLTAGEVIHHALAVLEANLDPTAQAVRDAAELAYMDYVRRLKDGHKAGPGSNPDLEPSP